MKNLNLLMLLLAAPSPALAKTAPIPATLYNENDWSLGTGYDTRNQEIKGWCVDNAPDKGDPPAPTVEEMEGDLSLRLEKDESRVADKLGITGSGRYQTGATTVSASADFMNDASKSEFRTSYTYVSEHLYRESLNSTRANPIRPLPQKARFTKDVHQWFDGCGDEFVQSRIRGARLFINVNVSFVSKTEKDHFNAKFGVESPVVSIKAEVDKNHEEFSAGNRMTVQAVQIGGDSANLGHLLCPRLVDGDETKPDPTCDKGSRAVVNCGFGDLQNCVDMVAHAMAYANGRDAGDFPQQIAARNNFAVTTLETVPYATVGDPFPRPPTDASLTDRAIARNAVLDVFNRLHKNYVFADQLWGSQAPRLSLRQKTAMEDIRNDLKNALEKASTAVDTCFDEDLHACNKAYGDLLKNAGLDKSKTWDDDQYAKIEALTFPETFVQYCDIADGDHMAIQRTVESLRAFAKSSLPQQDFEAMNTKGDRCANLALWLEARKEITIEPSLDANNPAIADLGPIAALKNLEVLSLRGQSLRDVSPLKALPHLRELDLSDNLIEDVSPLAGIRSLQKLTIQNNQLASVDSLGALKASMYLLDARGNKDGLSCPLAKATSCRIMSFANYADISSAYTKCDEIMHPAAVAIDDTHVLATGGRAVTDRSARIQLVDNQGCRAMPKALAVPRIGHTMTVTPNGILVIGGGTNSIERIDPKTFEPTLLPGTLGENATNHTATLLPDGRVLVVGGASDADGFAAMSKPQSLSGLVQLVDGNGKVEVIGHLAVPRAEHTATLLQDGTVLIVGGYSLNQMIDIAERIDPVRRTITTLPDTLPFGRSGHAAALLANGHVFIAGGSHWDTVAATDNPGEAKKVKALRAVNQLLDFDPATQKFRVLEEKLETPVTKAQAIATTDHRVLLIGGLLDSVRTKDGTFAVQTASKQIEVYDPVTEATYKVNDMLNRRLGFTATALANNSVLIFGGSPSWSYDKATDKISQDPFTTATELLVYRPR